MPLKVKLRLAFSLGLLHEFSILLFTVRSSISLSKLRVALGVNEGQVPQPRPERIARRNVEVASATTSGANIPQAAVLFSALLLRAHVLGAGLELAHVVLLLRNDHRALPAALAGSPRAAWLAPAFLLGAFVAAAILEVAVSLGCHLHLGALAAAGTRSPVTANNLQAFFLASLVVGTELEVAVGLEVSDSFARTTALSRSVPL